MSDLITKIPLFGADKDFFPYRPMYMSAALLAKKMNKYPKPNHNVVI